MQNSKKNHTSTEDGEKVNHIDRRNRINRMKTFIITLAVLLLVLPTIFCVFLGFQVNRLNKQMKDLLELHSMYGLSYGDETYAYAAEKSSDHVGNSEVTIKEKTDQMKNKGNTTAGNQDVNELNLQPQPDQPEEDNDQRNGQDSGNQTDGGAEEKIFAEKKVYLTFDDGPSTYTDDILDILSEYNVKATFFVVGKTDGTSKELYKRIVNEGHTLGMHSYSHKYETIYKSLEDFDKDFTKLSELLYDTTGYQPTIFRFPGGSDNLVNDNGMEEFIRYLNERSVVYFDWNVLNGDATGEIYTVQELIDNVLDGMKQKKNAIVLLHDSQSKVKTVVSLPGLIERLIDGGAELLPLDKEVTPIQMIKADSIK